MRVEELFGRVDQLGQDVMSRVIYGTRVSLEVGIFGTAVATLIGLFGTIFGLKAAFASVGAASAADRSGKLAEGIAIALNATGFGLLTAIPMTVAHSYLAAQAEQIIEQVDEFSVRLINALVERPDVRVGR